MQQSLFRFKRFIPWWLSGVSLFIIAQSFSQGQLYFEVLQSSGWSGMWIFWSSLLGSFIIPILFAPLWNKLQLSHDNLFYLERFPSVGGKILFHFRRYYVGVLVTGFLMAFGLITFAKLLTDLGFLDYTTALIFITTSLAVIILINSLDFQVKWDLGVFVLYLIFLLLIAIFVWIPLLPKHPETSFADLFPNQSAGWQHWLFYIGFQWWSTNQFDGGSVETSRFTGVDRQHAARKSAIVAACANAIATVLVAITSSLLANQKAPSFWVGIFNLVPEEIHTLLMSVAVGLMTVQVLAYSNWGAAMVINDPQASIWKSRTILLVLLGIASIIAFQSQKLLPLSHFVFAISAGVAPFYILRWIFPSIGPWTQIIVMVTSLLGTLLYEYIFPFNFQVFQLNFEESRTLIVGTITISVGLISWSIFPSGAPTPFWLSIQPTQKEWRNKLMQSLLLGVILVFAILGILSLL